MKKTALKLLCLVLAFATVMVTACGCQPADDNTAATSSNGAESESASSLVSSEATSSVESELPEPVDPERIYGNTVGNLNNRGLAAIQGNWIYFGTSTGVYKTKIDQSKTVKLCDKVRGSYINVSGAWVYFIDDTSKCIYKVRTDGTEFQQFSDQKAFFLSVVNGWAFYTVDSLSSAIYRTPLDRFEPKEIIKEAASDYCILQDKIYYKYDLKLYSTDLDGRNKVSYGKRSTQNMLIYDGYIYSTGNLTKQKLDGSSSQTFVQSDAFNVNVENGWIYYTLNRTTSSHKLYKIKTDGTENQMVSRLYCSYVNVVGDWIYFMQGFDIIEFSSYSSQVTLKHYRMKIDGTKIEALT